MHRINLIDSDERLGFFALFRVAAVLVLDRLDFHLVRPKRAATVDVKMA
jgi:hypothetical protein